MQYFNSLPLVVVLVVLEERDPTKCQPSLEICQVNYQLVLVYIVNVYDNDNHS